MFVSLALVVCLYYLFCWNSLQCKCTETINHCWGAEVLKCDSWSSNIYLHTSERTKEATLTIPNIFIHMLHSYICNTYIEMYRYTAHHTLAVQAMADCSDHTKSSKIFQIMNFKLLLWFRKWFQKRILNK